MIGGAMADFDGFLYWGTMQVPLSGAEEHYEVFPPEEFPPPLPDLAVTILGAQRAIAIFRCCGNPMTDVNPQPDTELLYGDPKLPVYANGAWSLVPNNMGGIP